MHVLHAPPYGVQRASSMQAWNFRTERWFPEVAEMPAGRSYMPTGSRIEAESASNHQFLIVSLHGQET
ncbi:hypothetical protein AK812_SmicGene9354 [Symbiodinium microadriaticum]|uniref:Uncharacterized protein n=1 Tax=Symbiodinium microadriaticum TaxID=2951 RepID=A0A1Q9EIJ8_SYMMI|nr:hypothetical protein AK812_SmicGene9354 [Symbiodinium microadriaticum]